MTDFIKSAAFAAKKSLTLKGIKVQHGVALEIVAAFLGYRTYAALVIEEGNASLKYHLSDAEIIVLDYEGGVSRLIELDLLQAFIVQDFIDAIVACRDGVFPDLSDFLNDYCDRQLQDVILSDADVIGMVEQATGSEPFSVELDGGWRRLDELWTAVNTWQLSCYGTVDGLADRPSADNDGEAVDVRCRGWMHFAKAGRAGLLLERSGVEAL
ncbi:hypothetical protein G7009_05790 [Pseudomonas capeferrum]|uniref:Uncharacterized protein n=1 Tax=Pseudomonas putida TaxID=303 RepID=A0A1Y3KKF5_PSEPU|nr:MULTISPECIES: hypothetical protein [Pseudomonas]EKT4460455.1 hypothetical protein [Pseudomonas putida]ELU0814910.1 hypothetical protein [Pseudomonas putida]MBA1201280.1 hypothetical protein [Pseudomonas capeferrum]OUM23712.1 hypothetical protein B8W72_27835 [Pseudomonas putida]